MTVQFITTPNGEELAVVPREEFEDLVDASAVHRASDALAKGEEEILTREDLQALLAAPTPSRSGGRSVSADELATRLEISSQEFQEVEAGRRVAALTLYRNAARILGVTLDDLAAG